MTSLIRRCRVILLVAALPGIGVGTAGAGSPAMDDVHGDSYYEYLLSQQAWFERDYESAVDLMRRAVAADPDSAELAVELAKLYFELDRPDEAAEVARRAIELEPNRAAARRILADSLMAIAQRPGAGREDLSAALNAYLDVARLSPDDPAVYLSLARLQVARGRLEQAVEALRKHLTLDPDSVDGPFLAAHVLLKLKRYDEAEAILTAAMQRRPHDPRLRLALAEAYEAEGDLENAVSNARDLLRLGVDPMRVHLMLARLSEKRERYAEAVEHFEAIAKMMDASGSKQVSAERSDIQLRMALDLMRARRFDDALEVVEDGIGMFPSDARFKLRKGEILLVKGRQREARIVLDERSARKKGDDDQLAKISDAYLSAGAQSERAGKMTLAEKLLSHAIDLNPRNDIALNYLGYMLADQGIRLDEAVGYIERALDITPDNGAYLDSLGWAYFKKGDYRHAERFLEDALAAMSEEPTIHAHMGDLYQALGRMEDAIRSWQEALDRGVENPDAIRERLSAARKAAGIDP
ncbi:MAG: tetratricopeptide repeat protein [Acidobacteriota bacterium]